MDCTGADARRVRPSGRRGGWLRGAVTELPEAGDSVGGCPPSLEKRQRPNEVDLTLIAMADRLVMLVGRGELHPLLARLAQPASDQRTAVGLLEHAVVITPTTGGTQTLARAYVEDGRDSKGLRSWSSR